MTSESWGADWPPIPGLGARKQHLGALGEWFLIGFECLLTVGCPGPLRPSVETLGHAGPQTTSEQNADTEPWPEMPTVGPITTSLTPDPTRHGTVRTSGPGTGSVLAASSVWPAPMLDAVLEMWGPRSHLS